MPHPRYRARVLDIVPDQVHQCVPFYTGSPSEVTYLESFLSYIGHTTRRFTRTRNSA